MISEAMGIPSARSGGLPLGLGLLTAVRPVGPLLTPDEVAAALNLPVRLHRPPATTPVPIEVTRFDGPDGHAAMTIVRTTGAAAKLALKGRASTGEPLVGLGDEARGGPGWIVVRRGADVLAVNVTGMAASTPPGVFAGLVHAAVARLTAVATQ
jgi:hypothetical protein